jgi:hypothetical protein
MRLIAGASALLLKELCGSLEAARHLHEEQELVPVCSRDGFGAHSGSKFAKPLWLIITGTDLVPRMGKHPSAFRYFLPSRR